MSDPADAPPASSQKKRRKSEGLDEPPPVVDSPDETKKKKKKRRQRDEDVEEISLPPPPEEETNIKKKKSKGVQKEEERIAMVTSDHNIHMEEKKNKKRNEEEGIAMETPDNNVPMEEKKKKKKRNEEEGISMVTPDNNVHVEKKKKKKRKVQNEEERTMVDEPPPVVSSPVGTKKKKKHKENEEESIAMVTTDHNVSMQEKKKRKRREEDEGVEMTFSPDEEEMEKKKRKKVKNEESIAMITTDSNHISSDEEKKNKQEENDVIMETFESGEKKRQKNKHSVTMVTTDKTMKSKPLVPMDTGNCRKKERKTKKRDEEEDCICIETTETGVKNITTVTKNKNTGSEHLEKNQAEQVTIETSKIEQQKKKRNQTDRPKKTTSQNNREGVPMETGDAWSDAQLQELQEYIPDVKKKSANVIDKLIVYDLPRFREFKKKGVALRWGRFSEEENQQIRDNLNDFLALTGLDSMEELVFPQRFKNKEMEIKTLRKNHQYIQKIAEGIPRSCLQVLVRARKMMDARNHMGRFTEDEVHALTKLHTLHGNDWKTIAEKMNRSAGAVLKRFATTGGVQGTWSPDEVSRLKGAVKDHLNNRLQKCPPGSGLTRQQLCVNLPWTKISLAVESRTWYQCRLKWFSVLKHSLDSLEGRKSTRSSIRYKINIINTLFDMNVRESRDVDWMEVAKAIGVATPVYAQKMFRRMKYSRVPNWEHLSYGEIVDILRETELPRLQIILDTLMDNHRQRPRHRQMPDSYQLSEIFPESGDPVGYELSDDELSDDELPGDDLSRDTLME